MGDPTLVRTIGRWECLVREDPGLLGTRYAVTRDLSGEIEHVMEHVDQNPEAVMVTVTATTTHGLTVLTLPLDVVNFVHGLES